MATHDYVIANASGAAFRTDLNNALAAIVSNNSNSSSPATTYAFQWWADTTNGVLKIRNSANNAWIELLQLDGTLTLEDGSASTPALAFRDDLNTGVFSSAADTFNVATGGVERLRINSTGLGIGTTSPSDKLHVHGDAGSAPKIIISEGGAESAIRATRNSDTNGDLRFQTEISGTLADRMVIDYTGKVGIGSSSPNSSLHVESSSNFVDIALRNSTSGSSGSDGADIFLNNNLELGIFNREASHIRFATSGSERLRLDSSGNLGLGTTSISDSRFRIKGANNTTSAYNDGLMVTSNNETVFKKYSWAGIETDGGMKFAERVDSSTLLTTMQISTAGNVTITGSLSKGSGSFKIDHPLPEKTDTHNLVHSFVEGPQADNIYRGKVDLVSGTATVNIDKVSGMSEGTFILLNRDIQCFTSNETGWTAVKGSVSKNILTITVEDNTCTDTISWLVIGERQDSHMKKSNLTDENGKIIVEPLKEEEED